jgi:hypothetical protein
MIGIPVFPHGALGIVAMLCGTLLVKSRVRGYDWAAIGNHSHIRTFAHSHIRTFAHSHIRRFGTNSLKALYVAFCSASGSIH